VDATYCKARVNRRVVSQAVVVATGVAGDGRREVLGFAVGDSEDGAFWTRGVSEVGCHATYSYSWISPPRTSQRRSRPKFGALHASAPADGTGVAYAKLRCGRRWL
jgi:Transposase, Mutator family